MAYTDALFQLGMDLTRSSTAQKEDHGQSALDAHDDRKDHFIERNGVRCAGTHLIIDLFGAKRLDDLKHIKETLKRCVEVAGATLLHIHLHHFTHKGGVSGVAVLAESHISIHSWPEAELCGARRVHVRRCQSACGHRRPQAGVQAGPDSRQGAPAGEHAERAHLGDRGCQESSRSGSTRPSGLPKPSSPRIKPWRAFN